MAGIARISSWKSISIIAVLSIFTNGCFYYDAIKELRDFKHVYGLVGNVSSPSATIDDVIVVLYSDNFGSKAVVQYAFPVSSGNFTFLVTEGVYYLAAFEDANNSMAYDAGEQAAYFGNPDRIAVSPASVDPELESISGLDIHIQSQGSRLEGFTRNIDVNALTRSSVLKTGDLASLSDSRFKPSKGKTGYWKPLTFLREFGFGVYFLEPYDPEKIPVLYVHGATGTPTGWQPALAKLDRDKFQPWFYYYPSGLGLDISSESLNKIITELHKRYQFKDLYIVAHSMGGLVARAFVNQNILSPAGRHYLRTFISIATPWGGVELAGKGAKKAPTTVPCWHDLDPQSDFMASLYKNKLPPSVRFHLLFTYKGDCSAFMQNNDGTIEMASLLDSRAQSESTRLYGYDEDHGSILTSEAAIEQIAAILDSERARRVMTTGDPGRQPSK